jgi:hypothetical protein
MKNSRNLRNYLRNELLSNFSITGNTFIKFNNISTIKSIKDKIRRYIKKKVDILERFISVVEQRRHYLKELSSIRENRIFVNDTNISGLDINDIPLIYFYSIKEKNKNFAFDIRELYQIILEDKDNPYTRIPFDNWIKIHVINEIEKRDIYPECFWYPIFGDINISMNNLFNIYCDYRENNDEFIFYSGEHHNNLVLSYYSGKEKEFKCAMALLCNSLPESHREGFLSTFSSY